MKKVSKNDRKVVTILSMAVDSTPRSVLLSKLKKHLKSQKTGKPIFIATPNAEHLVLAEADSEFKSIINEADITLPDSVSLVLANSFLSLPQPTGILRIPKLVGQGAEACWKLISGSGSKTGFRAIKGREFFLDLMEVANEERLRVFLLGAKGSVSVKAKRILQAKYPNATIQSDSGPILNLKGAPATSKQAQVEKRTLSIIAKFAPDIVFVAFGAPKQEKWISRHIDTLPVKVFMVVGGAFDYIAGETKLPPKFLSVNFEWLWRLIREPRRYRRIYNAVILFPFLVFKDKISRG